MRLRNGKIKNNKDVYTDMLEAGQTIIVRNCKIPVVNQHMRMQVDTFGKIEISKVTLFLFQSVNVEKVNQTNDVSTIVYDNFGKTNTKNDKNSKNKKDQNKDEVENVDHKDNLNEDYEDYY